MALLRRLILWTVAGVVVSGVPALAVDRPIDAVKLVLGGAGPQKLLFVSRDRGLPFPSIADDPATQGAELELFSPTEPDGVVLPMPAGAGNPGWVTKRRSFRFVNGAIVVVMKEGRMLKLAARVRGLALAAPQHAVGIRLTVGFWRACALFDAPTVDRPGRFVAKGARASRLSDCSDASLGGTVTTTTLRAGDEPTTTTTTTIPPSGCPTQEAFETIQRGIFSGHGCNVAFCHGGQFVQANLDLQPGAAYLNLVNVPAVGAPAKKRVLPGKASESFLSQKLHGTLVAGEGSPMPLVGDMLSPLELALVDAWIDGGAPQTGTVPGAPCLPVPAYEPAPALAPPPGGYQMVLDGPTLQPGQEQEGCLWILAPNATDFYVGRWEFSLNPGTHHFAIFEYNQAGAPATGVWQVNNFGCFMGSQFGNTFTGSPQAPYYVDAYPPGVARVMRAGSYLGLNAHYHNAFDVPIQVKVWINAYPFEGTPAHIAKTIIALNDTYSIDVPPFTVQTHPPPGQRRARYANTTTVPQSIISLAGHMHYRGLRFTIWDAAGTKLWENFDWSHPFGRVFTPALVLNPGEYLEYECLYDNGIDRPVRRNASGDPTDLVFGVSAEDAMCILTGQYYQ